MENQNVIEKYCKAENDSSLSTPPAPKRRQKSYRKKVEHDWSHEEILKLIQEIETRRGLWDIGCEEYKLPKFTSWQEIADALCLSSNDCKGKWTNLRTTFQSNVEKQRKKKSGVAANDDESVAITWKYFKPMMFLEANRALQSTQLTSSFPLNSTIENHSFMHSLPVRSSQPSDTGKRLSREVFSSDNSQSVNLNDIPVETPKPLRSQPMNTNTALCHYMASELNNLTPEQSSYARAHIKRAFDDIFDRLNLMKKKKGSTKNTISNDPRSSDVFNNIDSNTANILKINEETSSLTSYENFPSVSRVEEDNSKWESRKVSNKRQIQTLEKHKYEKEEATEDLVSLNKQKLKLEIHNLQLDAFKKKLELGLDRTEFTSELYMDCDVGIKEEI